MNHARWIPTTVLALAVATAPLQAEEGPFLGVDVGVSEPITANYRGHVKLGAGLMPFAGYMFTENLGIQGQLHLDYHEADAHPERGAGHNKQETTVFGGTIGPRFDLPLGGPFEDLISLYATAQGGAFTGLSGRVSHTAAGVSLGGGLDVSLTKNVAVGLFGRWNRSYQAPRPRDLGPDQDPDERTGEDIIWATGGISLKISFPQEEPAPAAAPEPTPVMERKFVLRNVYFDFDRDSLRPDALPILDGALAELREDEDIAVVAEGHADNKGSEKYNLGLSRRRAERVKKYLVDRGVAESRVRVEAAGETKPAAPNDTPEGRAKNRRVEIRVD